MMDEEIKDEVVTGEEEEIKDPATPTTLTLTEEELAKRIQSETDRLFQKAYPTLKEKARQELEEEKEKEKELSKLSAEDRLKREAEDKDAVIEKLQMQIAQKQVSEDTATLLAENGINTAYAPYLIGKDSAETFENFKSFKAIYDADIDSAVSDKLNTGFKPKSSTNTSGVTLEQFKLMSYNEQEALGTQNPELFELLYNQAY